MSYPRIYSLSTVGILKHYIQDYLLHPVRTDVIGPNGVGKSIIADLLQMLFIYDAENIHFGTESLKNDQRSINTLPYLTHTAYCFLNVEVSEGRFVILGIAINSQKGSRIVPFLITKNAEIESMGIDDLSLSAQEMLFSRDFLQGKTIPVLPDIPKLLLKKGLYINIFRTREEVNRYYRFLYSKEILPLNLSIEKNLKAFSKVIQSFSKAKTLDLSRDKASKSLQEFLFEESDKEILDHYVLQQESLDKILREYDTLNSYIRQLTEKQQRLIYLKSIFQNYLAAFQLYRKEEVLYLANVIKYLNGQKEEATKNHGASMALSNEIKGKLEKYPMVSDLLNHLNGIANINLENYGAYVSLQGKIEELDLEIEAMEVTRLPEFNDKWKNYTKSIVVENHRSSEFVAAVGFAGIYLKKYPDLEEMKEAWELQNNLIKETSSLLIASKKEQERVYGLIKDQSEKSLVNWCLTNKMDLSDDQKDLLTHFLSDPISRPLDSAKFKRFIDPWQLMDHPKVIEEREQDGFWLQLGPLNEFIAYKPEERLTVGEQGGGFSLTELLDRFKVTINEIEAKLEQLANINRGQPYDREILDIDIDILIINYDVIAKYQEKMSYLVHWEEKLADLERKKIRLAEDLNSIQMKMPANLELIGGGDVKIALRIIVNMYQKRGKSLAAGEAKLDERLTTVTEKIFDLYENLRKTSINEIESTKTLNILMEDYFKQYEENINLEVESGNDLDRFRDSYQDIFDFYKDEYRALIHQYEDHGNENPVATANEVDTKRYDFTVLEQALLGIKILSTDKIADALNDANRNRLSIADGIRDNMLKVFDSTLKRYRSYETQIQALNDFFHNRKISNRFYFGLEFLKSETLKIEFIEALGSELRTAAREGEIQFNQSIDSFIEQFFQRMSKMSERIPIEKLLNPKSYFKINISLTDEFKREIPGSTGESYSAIALLGIARLSVVQKVPRKGLRFIILEEIGSLDKNNFNTFPEIAKEFDYQIITMAPHPFSAGLSDEWYAHHLIKGKGDKNINLSPPASYFKTKTGRKDLNAYLNLIRE